MRNMDGISVHPSIIYNHKKRVINLENIREINDHIHI